MCRCTGARHTVWDRDRKGTPHCFAGLKLKARDLLAIGIMLLNGGRHNGRQLLRGRAVRRLFQATGGTFPAVALLWWRTFDRNPVQSGKGIVVARSISARGYLGQFLLFVPEKRLVAVRLQHQVHGERVRTLAEFRRRVFRWLAEARVPVASRRRGPRRNRLRRK